jgi:hypothetical protein
MAEAMAPVRLELFYGRPQEDPCQWLETFELFLEVNHVGGEQILRFVKYAMREDAYTWYKANQSDILDWEDCKTCLLERFGLDEDTLMYKVDTCNQQSGETVRSFSDRLRKLVGYLPNPLPNRMVSQLFVKGLVPHLRERVQMTFPGNAALPDLIRIAACYEQTFGHSPLGNGYNSQQQQLTEPLARPRNEHANQRNDRDNRQQRPPPQFNRDNQQRPWPRPRDQQPERRNQDQQQPQPVQPGPSREPAAPPRPDLDVLTREMERLRIQIAELQRPGPAANFTQFIEPEHHQPEIQHPAEQATIMYDGFTDPGWPNCWPSLVSKRPADTQPEPDLPPPLKRRPNNVENTTMDPNPPVRPAAARPVNPGEPTRPAVPPTPKPVPRRDVPRRPVDLGDLPPLPERNVYRRPLAVATPSVEPIQQIKGLPMKLTVQSYFNHISDEEFDKSMKELRDSRFSFLRSKRDAPPPQGVAAEVIIVQDNSTSPSGSGAAGTSSTHARQNLQRNIISTTVATVPIILRDTVFEEGIIDTGATNTMISQSAARQLGLIDQIEPSRLRYSCADGKTSSPWGILKKLPVGVEGLVFPIDVFVSGATSYDVLLGTDWLTQAHAEISFAKSEMSFRIDPNILGRVPITVVPADKALRYCMFRPPVRLPGDPGGPFAALPPELPEPDLLIEESSSDATSVVSASQEDAAEDLSTTGASTVTELEDEPMDPEDAADNAVVQFNASATTTLPVEEEPPLPSENPFITEDFMLERHIFNELESVWGPFDVDACCDEGGLNAQIPSYWSVAQDCLLQDWSSKNVYCHPPFSKIQRVVEHCLRCFASSPFTTGTVLVLPWWPTAPWFNTIIENFEIIKQYPPGLELFTVPGSNPGDPRRRVGPTSWPVFIVRIPAANRGTGVGLQKSSKVSVFEEFPKGPQSVDILVGTKSNPKPCVNINEPAQEHRDGYSPGICKSYPCVYVEKPLACSFKPAGDAAVCPQKGYHDVVKVLDTGQPHAVQVSPEKVLCLREHAVPYNLDVVPSLGWSHKCCSVVPKIVGAPTLRTIKKGNGFRYSVVRRDVFTTNRRVLKEAPYRRREPIKDRKLMFMEQRSPGDTVLIPKRLTMKERRGNGVAATIPCYTNEIAPPGILQLSALGGRPQPMLKLKGSLEKLRAATIPCCLYSPIVGRRDGPFVIAYDDVASLGIVNHLSPEAHGLKNNIRVAEICNVTCSDTPGVLQNQGEGRAIVPVFCSEYNSNYTGVTPHVAGILAYLPDTVILKAFPSQWFDWEPVYTPHPCALDRNGVWVGRDNPPRLETFCFHGYLNEEA